MVSGARPASDEGSMRLSMVWSYGTSAAPVEGPRRLFVHMLVLSLGLVMAGPVLAQSGVVPVTKPVKMVVLGDSLSAGFGLPGVAAFPVRLQRSLKINGIEVDMINAGVSG